MTMLTMKNNGGTTLKRKNITLIKQQTLAVSQ